MLSIALRLDMVWNDEPSDPENIPSQLVRLQRGYDQLRNFACWRVSFLNWVVEGGLSDPLQHCYSEGRLRERE